MTMQEFLKENGFKQLLERKFPIGVAIDKKDLPKYHNEKTNKWKNEVKKIEVRVWDNGCCTIIGKSKENNFYKYVSHEDGVSLLKLIFNQ